MELNSYQICILLSQESILLNTGLEPRVVSKASKEVPTSNHVSGECVVKPHWPHDSHPVGQAVQICSRSFTVLRRGSKATLFFACSCTCPGSRLFAFQSKSHVSEFADCASLRLRGPAPRAGAFPGREAHVFSWEHVLHVA